MAELPEHEAKSVRQYVEAETRDKKNRVKLVQKVGSRRVAGRSYEIYDVWMEKGDRWWVITNLTNLYSQDNFNSIEQAFTYHIGFNVVAGERFRPDEDAETVGSAWRRFAKATDAMNDASEAEDFQAVAIRCRETLLAMIREHMADDWVPKDNAQPQVANFKAWMDIFSDALATGRPRQYLKLLGEKSWDLTVWLQHYVDATEWDAELVLDSTAHLLNTLTLAIARHGHGPSRRCPQCESYRVDSDGEVTRRRGKQGWWSQDVCAACGWRGEEEFKPWTADHLASMADYVSGAGRSESGES